MKTTDLNTHIPPRSPSTKDQFWDLLFAGSALAGAAIGAIAGRLTAGSLLAGSYEIALSVFGALVGCWCLAYLVYQLSPAETVDRAVPGEALPEPVVKSESAPLIPTAP
jgi:hypothetical protein